MISRGATVKYLHEDGSESFYTVLGQAVVAGRDNEDHAKKFMVYQGEDGELFLRPPANFEARLALVCNHDTRLGNRTTGAICCADCKRRLA